MAPKAQPWPAPPRFQWGYGGQQSPPSTGAHRREVPPGDVRGPQQGRKHRRSPAGSSGGALGWTEEPLDADAKRDFPAKVLEALFVAGPSFTMCAGNCRQPPQRQLCAQAYTFTDRADGDKAYCKVCWENYIAKIPAGQQPRWYAWAQWRMTPK